MHEEREISKRKKARAFDLIIGFYYKPSNPTLQEAAGDCSQTDQPKPPPVCLISTYTFRHTALISTLIPRTMYSVQPWPVLLTLPQVVKQTPLRFSMQLIPLCYLQTRTISESWR